MNEMDIIQAQAILTGFQTNLSLSKMGTQLF